MKSQAYFNFLGSHFPHVHHTRLNFLTFQIQRRGVYPSCFEVIRTLDFELYFWTQSVVSSVEFQAYRFWLQYIDRKCDEEVETKRKKSMLLQSDWKVSQTYFLLDWKVSLIANNQIATSSTRKYKNKTKIWNVMKNWYTRKLCL